MSRQVDLDMLMMRSVASDMHFKYLDVLMGKWKYALSRMVNEGMFTFLWYTLTLRYNKTAWHLVDVARATYEKADKQFYTPLINTGLYWYDRQELDIKNNRATTSI